MYPVWPDQNCRVKHAKQLHNLLALIATPEPQLVQNIPPFFPPSEHELSFSDASGEMLAEASAIQVGIFSMFSTLFR